MATENDVTNAPTEQELPAPRSVLVVEDDLLTREIIRLALEDTGFAVHVAGSLAAMRTILACEILDLIILNATLPDGSAVEALAAWPPGERPPVICTSSNPQSRLRITAIQAGADDFMVKPVNELELAARAKALLRRDRPSQEAPAPVRCGGWIMEPGAERVLAPGGVAVRLTSAEARLLTAFVRNRGRPLTRSWLSMAVLRREWRVDDRSIDVTVGRLRRKLADHGGLAVSAVRYVGYRLDVVDDEG